MRFILIGFLLFLSTLSYGACRLPNCQSTDPKLDEVITAINASGGGGGGGTQYAEGAVTTPATGNVAMCRYLSAGNTVTNAQLWGLLCDSSNRLIVNVGISALPTGAATSALQTTGNTSLSSIDAKTPALVSGRQPVDGSGVTQPISAVSLPLPTSAATDTLQTSGNTSLTTISTNTAGLFATALQASDPGWAGYNTADINTYTADNTFNALAKLDTIDTSIGDISSSTALNGDSFGSHRGMLSFGVATTAAPSYGNATIQPFSFDASGNLRTSSSGSISGTVTANAGTNLNTSALALESGGNLASIVTNTTGIATAANQTTSNSSLSTIATNTTGIATAANQTTANTSLASIKTDVDKIPSQGLAATSASTPMSLSKDAITDCSGTITSGGVSQTLRAANASDKSIEIQNLSAETLWIIYGATAAIGTTGNYALAPQSGTCTGAGASCIPGGYYSNTLNNQAVSIIGNTTGDKFTCTIRQ